MNRISALIFATLVATPIQAQQIVGNGPGVETAMQADQSFLAVEGGSSASWLENTFESDYDKGFYNQPNASPVRPATSAFFKGPFKWELSYATKAVPQLPSSFENPLSKHDIITVSNGRPAYTDRAYEEFKINSSEFTIPYNSRNVFIQSEQSGQQIELMDEGMVSRVRGIVPLIVHENQYISMRITTDHEFQKSNPNACLFTFTVNGKVVSATSSPTFSDRKPFPKGEYQIGYEVNCNGFNTLKPLRKIDVAFFDEQNRRLPVVNLPYVNRDESFKAAEYKSPTLQIRIVENNGQSSKAGQLPVNLTKVSLINEISQAGGVFEGVHTSDKHFAGNFLPQEAGIYQFYVVTVSNVCAVERFDPDRLALNIVPEMAPDYREFCTDKRQQNNFWLAHPVVTITKDADETVFVSDVNNFFPNSQADRIATMTIGEDEVGKPVRLNFSFYANISNGMDTTNYSATNGAKIADIHGVFGGVSEFKLGLKKTSFASDAYKATQMAGIYVRSPREKFFRPLNSNDFEGLDVAEVTSNQGMNLDWLQSDSTTSTTSPQSSATDLSTSPTPLVSPEETFERVGEFDTSTDGDATGQSTMNLFQFSKR